jgi:hypothetical protein
MSLQEEPAIPQFLDPVITREVWAAMSESQRARIVAELDRYGDLGEIVWRAPPEVHEFVVVHECHDQGYTMMFAICECRSNLYYTGGTEDPCPNAPPRILQARPQPTRANTVNETEERRTKETERLRQENEESIKRAFRLLEEEDIAKRLCELENGFDRTQMEDALMRLGTNEK